MVTKHFFTDNIDSQAGSEAFGPIDNLNYNLTSRHSYSSTQPAYAICAGSILVQRDSNNPDLLNLVLKPYDVFLFGEIRIKYFIYKGITIDSLIDPNNPTLVASSTSNNLTETVWDYVTSISENNNPLDASISSLGLNYSSTGVGSDLKADNDLIDEVFMTSSPFAPPIVKGGDSIGTFHTSFGLEIVLDDFGFTPTFQSIRQDKTILTVPDLGTINTSALKLQDNRNRQTILNYLDPLCFFSMLFPSSLDGYSTSSISELISKFANHGRVYVDIRNERSNFYNYFNNYGDTINLNIQNNSGTRTFSTNSWPILIIENVEFSNSSTNQNIIEIALAIGDNDSPLIYQASNITKESFPEMPSKHSKRFIEPTIEDGYTSVITCVTYNNSIVSHNISRYIKLYYIKQRTDTYIPINNSVLLSENSYLDSIFSIDLLPEIDTSDSSKKVIFTGHLCYIDAINDLNFSGIVEIGICIELERVTFFCFPIDVFRHNNWNLERLNPIINQSETNSDFYSSYFNDLNKFITELQINNESVKTLSINEKPRNALKVDKSFENICCLSLTKEEVSDLISTANTFSSNLCEKYISVDSILHLVDESNEEIPYAKVNLGIQGVNSSGQRFRENSGVTVLTNSGRICSSADAFNGFEYPSNNPIICISSESNPKDDFYQFNKAVIYRLGAGFSGQKWPVFNKDGSKMVISSSNNHFVELSLGTRVTLLKLEFVPIEKLDKRMLKVFFWYSSNSYLENGFRIGYISYSAVRTLSIPRALPDLAFNYPEQLLESFIQDVEMSMFLSDLSYELNHVLYYSDPAMYATTQNFHTQLHNKIDTFRSNFESAILNKQNGDSSGFESLFGKFSSLSYSYTIDSYSKQYITNSPLDKLPNSNLDFRTNLFETADKYLQLVTDLGMNKNVACIVIDNPDQTEIQLKNTQTDIYSAILDINIPPVELPVELNKLFCSLYGLDESETVFIKSLGKFAFHESASQLGEKLGTVIEFILRDDLDISVITGAIPNVSVATDCFVLPFTYNWINSCNGILAKLLLEIDPIIEGEVGSFFGIEDTTGSPLISMNMPSFRRNMSKLCEKIIQLSFTNDDALKISTTPEFNWALANIVNNNRLKVVVPIGHRSFCEDARLVGLVDEPKEIKRMQLFCNGAFVLIDQSLGILNSNTLLSTIFHESNQSNMMLFLPTYPFQIDTHEKNLPTEEGDASAYESNWKKWRNFDSVPELADTTISELRTLAKINFHLPLLYSDYYLNILNS